MYLKRILAKSFDQHDELSLEFRPGLIGILGPNGAGKSNLISLIQFLLTGKMPGERAIEQHIGWGHSGFEGYLEAEIGAGIPVSVSRLVGAKSSFELCIGDEQFQASKEGYETLFSILDISPNMLSSISFVPQGELERLLFSPPATRNKAFQRLFRTESAERARQLLSEEANVISVSDHSEEIERLTTRVTANEAHEQALESELDKIDLALESDSNLAVQGKKESEQQAFLERQVENLQHQLSTAQQRTERLGGLAEKQEQRLEFQQLLSQYDKEEKLREQVSRLEKLLEGVDKKIAQTSWVLEVSAEELEKSSEEYAAHYSHLHLQLSSLQALEAALDQSTSVEEKCPVCKSGREISPGHCPICDSKLGQLDPTELKKRCSELARQEKEAEQLLAEAQEKLSSYKQACDASTRLHGEKSSIQQQLEEFPELVSLEKRDAAQKQLGALETIEGDPIVELKAVETRIEELSHELDLAQADLNSVDIELIARYNELSARMEHRANLDGQLAQLRQTLEEEQAQLAHLAAQQKTEELKRRYLDKLEEGREILHRDNLPALWARRNIASINKELKDFLERFDAPFDAWLREDLCPVAIFPNSPAPEPAREILSGGQKVSMAISFMLAIWNLFLSDIGFLFLDEPTQFLDREKKPKLVDVFSVVRNYCAESNRQIFVVTHDPVLEQTVDQCFMLE